VQPHLPAIDRDLLFAAVRSAVALFAARASIEAGRDLEVACAIPTDVSRRRFNLRARPFRDRSELGLIRLGIV
jgi:hypothetical protein